MPRGKKVSNIFRHVSGAKIYKGSNVTKEVLGKKQGSAECYRWDTKCKEGEPKSSGIRVPPPTTTIPRPSNCVKDKMKQGYSREKAEILCSDSRGRI